MTSVASRVSTRAQRTSSDGGHGGAKASLADPPHKVEPIALFSLYWNWQYRIYNYGESVQSYNKINRCCCHLRAKPTFWAVFFVVCAHMPTVSLASHCSCSHALPPRFSKEPSTSARGLDRPPPPNHPDIRRVVWHTSSLSTYPIRPTKNISLL